MARSQWLGNQSPFDGEFQVDYGHPLMVNMAEMVSFAHGFPRTFMGSRVGDPSGTVIPTMKGIKSGSNSLMGYEFFGTTDGFTNLSRYSYVNFGLLHRLDDLASGPFTVVMRVRHGSIAVGGGLAERNDGTITGTAGWSMMCDGSGYPTLILPYGTNNFYQKSAAPYAGAADGLTIGMTYDGLNASNSVYWYDNRSQSSKTSGGMMQISDNSAAIVTGTGTRTSDAALEFLVGNCRYGNQLGYNFPTQSWNGNISWMAIYRGVLNADVMSWLHQEPFAMLRPWSRKVYVGGASITPPVPEPPVVTLGGAGVNWRLHRFDVKPREEERA